MQRHELDVVSLLAGVVFVAIAGGYALTHTKDAQLHWLIVVPAFLLLVGAAATTVAVRRILTVDEPAEAIGEASDPT